jgi:2-polyprenyl-6-methoxyphenol hydroxylase-like FAD-dependent oxidoreductase
MHTSSENVAPDAIVVGAGPAGCTVSALLGRAGYRVVLVDRARVPRPRLCTHALMPAALPVLEDLGVLSDVLAAGAQRWWGVRLSMEGTRIEAGLPRLGAAAPHGLSLRRELLDPILLSAAERSRNVTTMLGWAALSPIVDGGAVTGVRLRSPSGEVQHLSSRIVVACDGRRSALIRGSGHSLRALPNRHVAWIAYVDGIPAEERPALEAFYRSGRSVSLLPCDGGLRVAGVILPGSRWSLGEAAERMLSVMRSFPELRDRLDAAHMVSAPVFVRGLRNAVRLSLPPGLAVAGDASLQSDPAFGQGITWALRGARRLAWTLDRALRGGMPGPVRVSPYAGREPLGLPLTIGMSAFSAIPPGSMIERLLIRSVARSPRTSRLGLRLAAGFATAAPDRGPRRSPTTFLREVLAVGVR